MHGNMDLLYGSCFHKISLKFGLLSSYTVKHNIFVQTFRRNVLPPSSWWLNLLQLDTETSQEWKIVTAKTWTVSTPIVSYVNGSQGLLSFQASNLPLRLPLFLKACSFPLSGAALFSAGTGIFENLKSWAHRMRLNCTQNHTMHIVKYIFNFQ